MMVWVNTTVGAFTIRPLYYLAPEVGCALRFIRVYRTVSKEASLLLMGISLDNLLILERIKGRWFGFRERFTVLLIYSLEL